MKKLILFAIIALSVTACSPKMVQVPASQTEVSGAVSSKPAKTANAEAPKSEAQKEISVSASDLLAQTLDKLSEKFGPAIKDGDGFRFDKIANVTLFVEDGVVRRIAVRNGSVDVFGARVGQTPAEITKGIGDPESSGKDEESDQYISQYKVNADTTAFFVSDDEKMPTSSVLISYLPIELPKDESQAPAFKTQAPSEKANVVARYSGSFDDGVIIEVTNAGMTSVKDVSVQIQVFGINPLGKNTSKYTYAMASRLDQGETKEIEVIIMSSYMTVTNVKIHQVTATAVNK